MHGKAVTVDCSPARLVLGAATKKVVQGMVEQSQSQYNWSMTVIFTRLMKIKSKHFIIGSFKQRGQRSIAASDQSPGANFSTHQHHPSVVAEVADVADVADVCRRCRRSPVRD